MFRINSYIFFLCLYILFKLQAFYLFLDIAILILFSFLVILLQLKLFYGL